MKLEQILNKVKNTRGTNAKKLILEEHKNNDLLRKALLYALNPYMPFHVVKVHKTKERAVDQLDDESSWNLFFSVANDCAIRKITGNAAIDALALCFYSVSEENETWMRKILKKHLAIGTSTKTVNSVIENLIPTFNVSLAQKFDLKRLKDASLIAIEPKLDGIRCFAIVENSDVNLYARSGKLIKNFDASIGQELISLGDGCYDGEIMGKDFISLMRQAYRKDTVDLAGTYFAIFDFLSLEEWNSKASVTSCFARYDELVKRFTGKTPEGLGMGIIPKQSFKYLEVVQRSYITPVMSVIQGLHDKYVKEGYEGAMIKDISAPYKFGRGFEVMKYKDFHDVDLPISQLLEGTGKHSDKLGSVVVCFNGVNVQVGSGFSDDLREKIWKNKNSFVGRMIEVRYQEVTPDGSLRFPTFVCFRNDR